MNAIFESDGKGQKAEMFAFDLLSDKAGALLPGSSHRPDNWIVED
jgi:hypothetical protein